MDSNNAALAKGPTAIYGRRRLVYNIRSPFVFGFVATSSLLNLSCMSVQCLHWSVVINVSSSGS